MFLIYDQKTCIKGFYICRTVDMAKHRTSKHSDDKESTKSSQGEQSYDPETFADRDDLSDKLKEKLKRLQEEDPNIYPVF
jgi:hypothetical protein